MKLKIISFSGLIVLILSLFLLPGCSDKELEELQAQLEEAKQKAEAALAEEAQTAADVEKAKAELVEMEEEYEVLQEIEAAQAELDELNAQLDDAKKQYDDLNAKFTAFKEQYTPHDFSSLNELRAWLANNNVSEETTHTDLTAWLTKAQHIQEDALRDGYLVNINYFQHPTSGEYYVHCTTAINGFMYAWDPDTDEVFYDGGITGVK